jgi:hypothetical protein
MVSIILYTSYKGFNFLLSVLPNFSSQSNVLPIPEPSSVLIPPILHYSHIQKSCPNSTPNLSPIMIISNTCKIRPDHYRVSVSEGRIHLHSVVQDYLWPGVLVVVGFVAENEREIVAECVGRDEQGNRIIRYLVVEKGLVDRSWTIWKLPRALGEDWYMSRGSMGVEVSVPYFLFPLSDSISSSSLLVSDGNKGQNLSSTLSILSSFFWCV